MVALVKVIITVVEPTETTVGLKAAFVWCNLTASVVTDEKSLWF